MAFKLFAATNPRFYTPPEKNDKKIAIYRQTPHLLFIGKFRPLKFRPDNFQFLAPPLPIQTTARPAKPSNVTKKYSPHRKLHKY